MQIIHSESLEALRKMSANSVDAVVYYAII